jgi:DNA-binding NarL/FixJ family response regulator
MSQPGERPIRVLLVDDHVVVRKGLRALFEQATSIEVVGEAEDGEQAVQQAERLRPEVILMDLEMPRLGGVEATRRITEMLPDVRVLVLTSHTAEADVFPALKAGAQGYLLKHSAPEDVLNCIPRLHAWFCRSCTGQLAQACPQRRTRCRTAKSTCFVSSPEE